MEGGAADAHNPEASVTAGVSIPDLVLLLSSTVPDPVRAAAVTALGELACTQGQGPNKENQALISELGAIPQLVHMLSSSSDEAVIAALDASWRVARDNDENKQAVIEAGLFEQVTALLQRVDNPQIVEDACYILGQFSWMNPVCQAAIVEAGGIQSMVSMVLNQELPSRLRAKAAAVLANMANKVDSYRDMIMQAGALPGLMDLLRSQHCWVSKWHATETLMTLAWGSEANAVAIRQVGAADELQALVDRVPKLIAGYNNWGVYILGTLCLLLDPESEAEAERKTQYVQLLVSWFEEQMQGLGEQWSPVSDEVSNLTAALMLVAQDGWGCNAQLLVDAGAVPLLDQLLKHEGGMPDGTHDAAAQTLEILQGSQEKGETLGIVQGSLD